MSLVAHSVRSGRMSQTAVMRHPGISQQVANVATALAADPDIGNPYQVHRWGGERRGGRFLRGVGAIGRQGIGGQQRAAESKQVSSVQVIHVGGLVKRVVRSPYQIPCRRRGKGTVPFEIPRGKGDCPLFREECLVHQT